LDWELVHLGDPLEDVAWCASPLWRAGTPYASALLPPEEFAARWADASGHAADAERLCFYEVLAFVKMIAIMLSGLAAFRSGRPTVPRPRSAGRPRRPASPRRWPPRPPARPPSAPPRCAPRSSPRSRRSTGSPRSSPPPPAPPSPSTWPRRRCATSRCSSPRSWARSRKADTHADRLRRLPDPPDARAGRPSRDRRPELLRPPLLQRLQPRGRPVLRRRPRPLPEPARDGRGLHPGPRRPPAVGARLASRARRARRDARRADRDRGGRGAPDAPRARRAERLRARGGPA